MKRLFSFVFVLACLFVSNGCGNKLPDDLPKLYPCTITILTKDGEPVEAASVAASDPETKWAGIALTDAQGKAVLKTNGTYPGLAAGPYKIVVTKYDVTYRGRNVEALEKPVFDKMFASEETTPLECVVEEKSNEFQFEVW